MPFLTRDFALFLGLVAFLISGITATVARDVSWGVQNAAVVTFADEMVVEEAMSAVVSPPAADMRKERIVQLTRKVRDFLSTAPSTPEEEVVVTETSREVLVPVAGTVLTCQEYGQSDPLWVPQGLQFEVVEGALLVFRERENLLSPEMVATGTVVSREPLIEREVVLQLPHRLFRASQDTCIATDVVGIALDGSLIRNHEQAAYGVFGSETLIGYALDGFPIYGVADFTTDTCGGSDQEGEYRYYLHKDRPGVLGCFAATPVVL